MGTDGEGGRAGQSAGAAAAREEGGGKEGKEGAGRRDDPHKCCGCRFPLLIAALQLLLAIAITVVAFIMRSISSSLLLRDTPYWVGIIICLAALLGFYMYCITYEVDEQTARQFIVKCEQD
ncbi:sarcospan isoform X2 [Pristis pectinata]|uniref:sarcospan isoform X2 n=1 Tax=Pristis pectinata TaxID=685728 RepID=UPI00223E7A15|nr:sarcospan isoform X2 [Pristis pectinata]